MSSNIKVKRVCRYCGEEFTARTTTTKFCSKSCNSRDYKARIKANKVQKSNNETEQIKTKPIEDLKAKEFLTVRDVAKLIGCSRQNVYKLINNGKLNATNILIKKTIVRRCDIDKLFIKPEYENYIGMGKQINELYNWKQAGAFDIEDCYTMNEVMNKYSISEAGLQKLIKRESVPKIKKGWNTYFPKIIIDKILKRGA
jgi:excisionase family DNA binding protein